MRFLENRAIDLSTPRYPFPGFWERIAAILRTECEAQAPKVLLWIPVSFAVGIGLYFLLPSEPPAYPAFFVCTASALFTALHYKAHRLIAANAIFFVFTLPAFGFLAAIFGTSLYGTPILQRDLGPVMVEATIESIELLDERGDLRVLLGQLDIQDLKPEETPRKVRLRFKGGNNQIQTGQRARFLVELMPPSAPVMPDGFDFRRHFFFQGIGAVGFIYRLEGIVKDDGDGGSVLEYLRVAISYKIHKAMPEQTANITEALMIGRRAGIPESVLEALRGSGLAHLLAISGLHIGLVAGALFFFTRLGLSMSERLALHYPIKKYAAIVAILGAFIYMVLAGAPTPTQRAMIMTAIVFGAILLDRWPFSMRVVAVSAFLVLLLAPHSLLSVSFQLSFAAVVILVASSEALMRKWNMIKMQPGLFRRVAMYFGGVCSTTILASLATAPFTLFHFQHVATLGIAANLFAIPLMAFVIMPAGILAMLLMPLGLEYWPLVIMGYGIDHVVEVAIYFSEMEWSATTMSQYSFASFLCMVGAGLALILFQSYTRIFLCALFIFGAVLTFEQEKADILISREVGLIGVTEQNDNRLILSSLRRDKFTADVWSRALNMRVDDGQTLDDWELANCDADGCRINLKGKNISIVKNDYALAADCEWADIIIADFYTDYRCHESFVIDKWKTRKYGTHSVHIDNGNMFINVAEPQSTRPWQK